MARTDPNLSSREVWAPRLALWSLRLAIVSLAVSAIGLTLARYDLIAKLAGFSALLGGGLIAALALILGIASLVAALKTANPARGRGIAGIAISLAYVGFLASRPLMVGDAPAIHDITTDLANPPQFEVLALRPDNLTGVGTVENWRKIHAEAYGSLGPITVAKPVAETTADAVRLAKDAGWTIAVSDLARGHVEATASVSYIRFQDDVVIRIVPTPDDRHSRVDMRSVSRVGVGDLGVNARRIRSFLEALATA
ncbi:MAG: DUF1499 domain-containing protein [Novosphingobium sp.]